MRIVFLLLTSLVFVNSQLSPTFYQYSCPSLLATVKEVLEKAIHKEARVAASLLRLHFHDCFVNGCDGSVLLDDQRGFTGEKTSNPNRNSARGFDVVDDVKAAVERVCPGVVSCADILAILAEQSVVLMNGPSWTVSLGRRDSTTASLAKSNSDIPPPTSTLRQLVSKFQAKRLNVQELVALSGAHTIGLSRCTSFKDRLYNFSNTNKADPSLGKGYLQVLQSKCPRTGSDDNGTVPLDFQSPTRFDNMYFGNLETNMGLLNSDQVLYSSSGSFSKAFVSMYKNDESRFFKDFANAMVKMGKLSPLTGKQGQIRKNLVSSS